MFLLIWAWELLGWVCGGMMRGNGFAWEWSCFRIAHRSLWVWVLILWRAPICYRSCWACEYVVVTLGGGGTSVVNTVFLCFTEKSKIQACQRVPKHLITLMGWMNCCHPARSMLWRQHVVAYILQLSGGAAERSWDMAESFWTFQSRAPNSPWFDLGFQDVGTSSFRPKLGQLW